MKNFPKRFLFPRGMVAMDKKCRALIELGRLLQLRGYRFVAVAPSTHNRVLRRKEASPSLESVFGRIRKETRTIAVTFSFSEIELISSIAASVQRDASY